jgi:hypothetical protein
MWKRNPKMVSKLSSFYHSLLRQLYHMMIKCVASPRKYKKKDSAMEAA